jgi:DNA-binding transcriptional ArsR family regulator
MPALSFETGSAYDLFISLWVLHHPANFGLRPAWAAGVRSRLPAEQRAVLEQVQTFLPIPLTWLAGLPAPEKSARLALAALEALAPARRLAALTLFSDTPPEVAALLDRIALQGAWSERDLEPVRQAFHFQGKPLSPPMSASLCQAWANAPSFSQAYLLALKSYCAHFFFEEEEHNRPALENALQYARQEASALPLPALLETLSRGVRFDSYMDLPEITLVPSYWASPLVFYARVSPQRLLLVFGARQEQTQLPGDVVSPGLISSLKALADPTRLRILRYLGEQPLTPTDLARRLRLRPPTISHHLTILRLAGLVQVILQPEGERCYAPRREALQDILKDLDLFVS